MFALLHACVQLFFLLFWFYFFIFNCLLIDFFWFHLPVQEEKLAICVCCSERTPCFYSLSSFMVPICTILKVLILVYMQNIPVLQRKHVTKIKKLQHHTYIFWTLYCCFTMCFNLRSKKKRKKKQLWNKCSFYKMTLYVCSGRISFTHDSLGGKN